MQSDEFEARQRAREWFHSMTVPLGAWTVLRVDGRAFSRFTEQRFDKPFDPRFSQLMVQAAQALLTEFDARYAYTESDEISVLLHPAFDLFGRGLEKLVSLSAGVASAAFTAALFASSGANEVAHSGQSAQSTQSTHSAHFDSRAWVGTSVEDVVDYFSWRQTDALRCALNGWCYWTLRNTGQTRRQATKSLDGATKADKNELLFQHGINFNDDSQVPVWQRRGIGLWWQPYEHTGYDPIRQTDIPTTRRRIHIERELPTQDTYRKLITDICQ